MGSLSTTGDGYSGKKRLGIWDGRSETSKHFKVEKSLWKGYGKGLDEVG